MMIWFLLIIIILAVIFAIMIYVYDDTQFKKMTNYSYFQVIFNNKNKESYKLYRSLESSNKKGKVLLNVQLPNANAIIDAIYIQPSGIFVIDMKNLNGWLYGHEKAIGWKLVMYKEKVYNFPNPIAQIEESIKSVENIVSVNKEDLFHPLIVFSNNTVIKKLEMKRKDIKIMNLRDLKSFMKKENKELLSDAEIEAIYKSLEPYMTNLDLKQMEKLLTN